MKLQFFILVCTPLLLSGCFQEDPQVQQLRDERDAALAKVGKLEESVAKLQANGSSASGNASALQKQVDDLKGQLEIAKAEVKKAQDYAPEILSEEELLIRLRGATEEHRKAIRERFDVQNIVLTDFSMPEKLTHPYRCGVQYDLLEKSTGEPYHLDVNVRAAISGKWEIPPVAEFANKIKKGARTMVASNSQGGAGQLPAGGVQQGVQQNGGVQSGGGIQNQGGHPQFNPSNPSGAIVTYPSNNTVTLPGQGGGQTFTPQQPSQHQPGGQPQAQPGQGGGPPPRGPGMPISKDIKVNW
ncbi:hypothetical protein VSU19_13110 [Verrucomicrobiales bacterium BCK34]|nr:hypothetical protein [Verrucomicrobiales bacterium BCK34]